MKVWVLLTVALFWVELQNGVCQQLKRRKETGENRIRPGGKRLKGRFPKLKEEKEAAGRSQNLLTQVLDKGRFLRLGESLVLAPGKTLELRCKGSRISWSYPPYLDTFNDSRLSIKQQDRFGQLILTAPSAADTGEFSCWGLLCDGDECDKDPERTSATYIYFTDQDDLFVPSAVYFEIVYLRPDAPAIVPCRVSSPLARVSLHREVPPEEVPTNGTLVTYDPTKGFILQSPTPEHQGVFYCKAVTRNTPQISSKYQLLYVEVPRGPPFVTLKSSPSSARDGDSIDITCTVLGEPEVDVSFSWTYPSQPVAVRETWRLINRGVGYTTRISQSVVVVEAVAYGNYVCRAKSKHGETSVATRLDPE